MVNRYLLDMKLKEVNLTYGSLANLVGCTRGTVYNIKNGKTYPSYQIMNSVVYVLGLSPTDIQEIFFGQKAALPVDTLEILINREKTTHSVAIM